MMIDMNNYPISELIVTLASLLGLLVLVGQQRIQTKQIEISKSKELLNTVQDLRKEIQELKEINTKQNNELQYLRPLAARVPVLEAQIDALRVELRDTLKNGGLK